MDWHTRRVLSWRVSNTLDSDFCVEALEEALQRFGKPEIFNTDQGAQFTSEAFTGVLKAHGIAISMDGVSSGLNLQRNHRFQSAPLDLLPLLRPHSVKVSSSTPSGRS